MVLVVHMWWAAIDIIQENIEKVHDFVLHDRRVTIKYIVEDTDHVVYNTIISELNIEHCTQTDSNRHVQSPVNVIRTRPERPDGSWFHVKIKTFVEIEQSFYQEVSESRKQ